MLCYALNVSRLHSSKVSPLSDQNHLVPKENPQVGKIGLGATFVSGTLRCLRNNPPNEIWSRRKIRKLERAGWERPSFLELCGFSKIVLRRKFGPEGKSASGKERAGSGFRFWNFAVSQKWSSGGNLVPKETPQVGKNGLGATFVSETLWFFKNCHPKQIWSRKKIRKWERAGWERLRFWNFAASQKWS